MQHQQQQEAAAARAAAVVGATTLKTQTVLQLRLQQINKSGISGWQQQRSGRQHLRLMLHDMEPSYFAKQAIWTAKIADADSLDDTVIAYFQKRSVKTHANL